jgi:hypothetical protein
MSWHVMMIQIELHKNTVPNKCQKKETTLEHCDNLEHNNTSNNAKDSLAFSVEMTDSDKYCNCETSTSEVSLLGAPSKNKTV